MDENTLLKKYLIGILALYRTIDRYGLFGDISSDDKARIMITHNVNMDIVEGQGDLSSLTTVKKLVKKFRRYEDEDRILKEFLSDYVDNLKIVEGCLPPKEFVDSLHNVLGDNMFNFDFRFKDSEMKLSEFKKVGENVWEFPNKTIQ